MKKNEETLFAAMVQALIGKYGLMLSSAETAETLGISIRTLDDRRRAAKNCPEYIEARKGIMFPVQKVVEFQVEEAKKCIKII